MNEIEEQATEDEIKCQLCNRSLRALGSHLATHGIDILEYCRMFPHAPTISVATSRCISESLTGYEHGEEFGRKISESLIGNTRALGYHHTDDARRRISESLTGHEVSFETRQAIGEANLGHVHTEEAKRAMSIAHTGIRLSEETKQKLSEANKGRTYNNFPGSKGHVVSEEARQKIARGVSETMKEMWKDPEFASRVARGCNRKPNQSELRLQSILDKHFPNEWKYVGDNQFGIEGRYPDFVNVNGKKQVIELFSPYWHDPVLFPGRMSEEELIAHYKKYGFDCLVIWEYDAWNEALVLKAINKFLGDKL